MFGAETSQLVDALEPVHGVAILRASKRVQIREALALNHLGGQQDFAIRQPDNDFIVGLAWRVLQVHLHTGDFDVERVSECLGRSDEAPLTDYEFGTDAFVDSSLRAAFERDSETVRRSKTEN